MHCNLIQPDSIPTACKRAILEIAFATAAVAVGSTIGTTAVSRALTLPRARRQKSLVHAISRSLRFAIILSGLTFLCFSHSPALGQSKPVDHLPEAINLPDTPEPTPCATQQEQQSHGTVSGRVIDQNGNGVAGADVTFVHDQVCIIQLVQSDEDGQFTFALVPSGPFQLRAAADGFATQAISSTLRSGENYVAPQITLSLATQITEIYVSPSPQEIEQEEFKDLTKQRVLGIVPNFYVSYLPEAAPLTSKQKFQLALRATTDPVSLGAVGMIAGVDQAANRFSGYGQGAQGYAKRYGASYGNFASRLFIGGAILPSILKQDPRYFYKGTGTNRSRFLYAISRTLICKGDNQQWQPDYSSIFGDLAAGGISNLYIPEKDRHGASLTFENAAISLGTSAVINILQEFVLHNVTSRRQ